MSFAPEQFHVVPIGRGQQSGPLKTGALQSQKHHVLLWFTKGQGRITVEGLTRGYSANNAIFIPSGTMFAFEMAGPVLGTAVHFPVAADLALPQRHRHYRIIELQRQAELTALVDAMQRELAADAPAKDRAVLCHAGLLSVWLERRRGDFEAPQPASDAAMRLVANYTRLIERDLSVARGVADYAAELGVTATHLTRSCRKTCGKTALALLNARVINEARRRLRETNLPIKEIGRSLGFTSAAYFTRSFLSHTGQTPRVFRKAA